MTLRRSSTLVRRTRLRTFTGLARTGPPKPVSAKRAGQMDAYRAAKAEVKARAEGACEMRTPVCVGFGVEPHHVKGRVGPLLTDTEWMMHTCRPCHNYAHDRPAEAYENGWLASRHGEVSA